MHLALRLSSSVALAFLALSCGLSSSEPTLDWVDTPELPPQEVPAPASLASEAAEPLAAAAEDPGCGPTSARHPDGACKRLETREQGEVQQVRLPAATFVMGDIPLRYDARRTRTEPDTHWSGNPPRHVAVDGFWVDLHEVTRSAYAACVERGECTPAECPEGEQDPALSYEERLIASVPQTCVTHAQAQAYCRAQGGRLPTEAEWEYAGRGVDARLYAWGNEFRDEFTAALMPVGGPSDFSYFGLRGFSTNAAEWVAEPFALDVGLRSFVDGSFRRPAGPLGKLAGRFDDAFTVKGGRLGARRPVQGAAANVGFRCVADLPDDLPELTAPAAPPPVPSLVSAGGLQIFGGVAEAVDRAEAEAFCAAVAFEWAGSQLDDWRLPTLSEVQSIAEYFRGPGPFWTAEGAAMQEHGSDRGPWVAEPAERSEPLAARCVRG